MRYQLKLATASLLLLPVSLFVSNFENNQLNYERVRGAKYEKEHKIEALFTAKGIDLNYAQLYFRAFKMEQVMEVWASNDGQYYQLIELYDICNLSGDLGPKRKEGDYQMPEGYYHIDRYNPNSSYHLSLGLNYPNQSDRVFANKFSPGGDIFIHGTCATVGCLPITNDKIKELYWMAVKAKASGQDKIPVHIYPCHFNQQNIDMLWAKYGSDPQKLSFWNNIIDGYRIFEETGNIPTVSVNWYGQYEFN